MAGGLLDFLQTPEAQTGLALLAAGGPSAQPMSAAQRIQMALVGAQAQQDAALKRQLLQSQVTENATQNDLRKAQLARLQRQDDYYLGGALGGSAGAPASPSASIPGASPGGEVLKQATGVPAGAPAPAQGKFNEWSQKYGIPVDALISDYFSNGGKGIAEMLMKRGTPDMQVTNGYAYDKNRVQPGFLPALNTSQDGKSTMTLVDPNTGLPRVLATPGAVDAFAAFQGVQDRSRAAYTPGRPVIMEGGRMGGQSQLQEITGSPAASGAPAGYATEPQMRTTAQGDMGGTVEQYRKDIADIQASLKQPLDDGSRRLLEGQLQQRQQQLAQYFPGQLATPAQPAVQGGGLEFSPAEKAQQAAQQAQAVDTAKADVVRDTANKSAGKLQAQSRSAAEIAAQLLDQGPTASGVGAWADKANAFFGVSGKRSDAAQQLEALSGWMVSNVPRMEGPQSDADVRNYQNMAGRVGDRTLPISARKAALQTVMELQQKYADINGTPVPGGAPSAKLKAPPSMNDLQNTALKYGMTVEQVKQKLGIQ